MFGGLGGNQVNVRITGDASDLRRETATAQRDVDQFSQRGQRSVSKFSSAVKGALAIGAAAAVGSFVKDSIQSFSDLEQAVGGTEAVFGDARGVIDEFAKTSAESIGLAEEEFRVSTTLIGGQLKRMTGDVEFAAEQSIILTETAADLAATYGGTTKQAVEALGSAFRGEADPAERFNLDLKVGRVNAKAVEMGLADTTSQVDDYAKAQAILALISEQSADAQGQFAREIDTVAGRTQRLTARFEDLKAASGGLALGPVEDLATIADGLMTVAQALNISAGESEDAATSIDVWGVIARGSIFSVIELVKEMAEVNNRNMESEEDVTAATYAHRDAVLATRPEVKKHADALYDTRDAAMQARPEVNTLAGEQRDLREATQRANAAAQEQIDKLRAMSDPFFAALQAVDDLEQAQQDWNEAVEEGDLEAQEDAVRDIAGATLDLKAAYQELVSRGIDPASDAGKTAFRDMGLSEAQIDLILRQFQRIEDNAPHIRATIEIPDLQARTTSTSIRWSPTQPNVYHQGGVVPGLPGQEQMAMVQGGETILPTQYNNGNGGNRDVTFTLSDGSQMGAQEMIEALTAWQRHNGPLPLKVTG